MKARATKFNKLFLKLMKELGAVESNVLLYTHTLMTNEGLLHLKVDKVEDSRLVISVIGRFDKPHGRLDSNPYSGKWNHHWSNNTKFNPDLHIDYLRDTLIKEFDARKPTKEQLADSSWKENAIKIN
jgi:hypothetical protein